MRLPSRLAAACLALIVAAFGAAAHAGGPACRIAFDVGSSGIRAGTSEVVHAAANAAGGDERTAAGERGERRKARAPHADIDYLAPQWAGQGLAPVVAATVAALRELPVQGGFPADCARLGAGFSAWRLALGQDAAGTAVLLAQIREESGVPLLVMPQPVEAGYGYAAARALLGERLQTSHVLDIGGGSLQIAGAADNFGIDLGQKAWHRLLCQRLRPGSAPDCDLQPLSRRELAQARALLARQLRGAAAVLSPGLTLTAISRPVTRGVFPAVARLLDTPTSPAAVTRARLAEAIGQLAAMPAGEALRRLDTRPKYLTFLLSDLLLVEGVLAATGAPEIRAADVDLSNLPALLVDDQAYAWGERYGCYLARLQRWGAGAYYTDPASCPPR